MRTIDLHTADGVIVRAPGHGILLCHGTTVPSDGSAGYATGCLFIHTDGSAGTAMYSNEGSDSSCDFNAVAALTATQEALLGATAGTVTASKAAIPDANKDLGDFRNLDAVNLDAGSSGAAGTVDVFPSTASKGKFILACTDQDGDTNVTLKPAAMGQASVVSIPDPGAATANVLLTDAANDGAVVSATAAEIDAVADASAQDQAVGTGADGATVLEHAVTKVGNLFYTQILIDLDGLADGGTANDIIGEDGGVANCHLGQITAATHGTIFAGRMTCLETPAGGDPDIDLYGADGATGANDANIDTADSGSADKLTDHGDWTDGDVDALDAFPEADNYLYLACGDTTDAAYTAGKFLIELWGV